MRFEVLKLLLFSYLGGIGVLSGHINTFELSSSPGSCRYAIAGCALPFCLKLRSNSFLVVPRHFPVPMAPQILFCLQVVWMSENSTLSGSLMPHMGLFVPTIIGQGSAEQVGWWLFKALTFEIVGAYAQVSVLCVFCSFFA